MIHRRCSAPGCRKPAQVVRGLLGWCSVDCGALVAERELRRREKKQEKAEREERKHDRARLLELKPISYHLKRTRDACHRYIRLRDAGKPCICCGQSTVGQDVDAGHFLSVGSSPDMRRFDPDNIHAQLVGCNRGRTQPPRERFREHMIERIGLERVLRLEGPWPVAKWTREGLAEMRAEFLEMAKALEKTCE